MRTRWLALTAAVLAVLLLVGSVVLAVEQEQREQHHLDLQLQRAVDRRVETIERGFETARAVSLSLASNAVFADLYAVPRPARARADAEAMLMRLSMFGQHLRSLAFVGPTGVETVRITDGQPVPAWQLSSTEGEKPYFAAALALGHGEVAFTRPYQAEPGGRWVISAAAAVPVGRERGVLRADIPADAFLTEASVPNGQTVAIADHETRRVVADQGAAARGPRVIGAGEPALAWLVAEDREVGVVETDGLRLRYRHVHVRAGNTNHWLVAATAPVPSGFGLHSFGTASLVHLALAAVLALVAALLARRVRRENAARISRVERARQEAERQSRTDALTGLLNRRGFAERLRSELLRASRDGRVPGLLIADVDRFKSVNDTYGHLAGDAVLRGVAGRLAAAAREYDVVARWGGEEFVVLVPDIASAQALRASAERLRSAVAAAPVMTEEAGEVAVTVSIGGAIAGHGLGTAEELANAADRAMYVAKRSGGDCVRLASELEDGQPAADEPEAVRIAQALAFAASVRERVPITHFQQVADIAARTAEELGLPEADVLRSRLGGWVHDVGKVAVPDALLDQPGPLGTEQWELVRAHAEMGASIVARVPALREAAAAVRHHHERWDGTGYPDGLAGEAIPVEARVVAAADAYSAIVSERPYSGARGTDEAIEELRAAAGSHLDPEVVDALVRALRSAGSHPAEPAAAR